MPEIIVYVNGDFEPIDNASIPFNDSGFQLEIIKRTTPLEDTIKHISGYLTLIVYLEV